MKKRTAKKCCKPRKVTSEKFYTDDGVLHEWPTVQGWDLWETDGCDIYGYCTKASYQHLKLHTIVTFDGSPIETGKTGSWSYNEAGQQFKGTFKSEQEVPTVLKKIAQDIPRARTKALKDLERKSQIKGYELLVQDYDFTYTKILSTDYHISVDFMGLDDVLGGNEATWFADVSDTGSYQGTKMFRQEGTIDSLAQIPKVVQSYERKVMPKMKKYISSTKAKTGLAKSTAKKTDLEIIKVLCTAGKESLAKQYARERGYKVKGDAPAKRTVTAKKLMPGQKVKYSAKFLKSTGQISDRGRKGVVVKTPPGGMPAPRFVYVQWDDEKEPQPINPSALSPIGKPDMSAV